MRPFDLTAPATVEAALASPGTFLAGGTTLVDLMKLNVMTPEHVTDINALPLRGIDTSDGLRIGALERMSDVARHPGVYPAISRALLLSASQQLRNMARPWRLPSVEAALRGAPMTPEAFEEAASPAAEGAWPLPGNAFKVSLLRRTIVRALVEGSR
jgi:CO/xanthine dehydrogenase FAD-binding subunit